MIKRKREKRVKERENEKEKKGKKKKKRKREVEDEKEREIKSRSGITERRDATRRVEGRKEAETGDPKARRENAGHGRRAAARYQEASIIHVMPRVTLHLLSINRNLCL